MFGNTKSKQTIKLVLTPAKLHSQLNKNNMELGEPTEPSDPAKIPRNHELFQDNLNRSENEQLLFNEWKRAENEKNALSVKMEWLESQLNIIKKQYTELQEKLAKPESKDIQAEYHTDEEELAKETEWIRRKDRNHKRKRMDTSLTPPQNKETVQSEDTKNKGKKTPLPPPVVVDGIEKFNELYENLSSIITEFQIKIINNENIKINVKDGDCYRLLTKMLLDQNMSWYSYENKQNRPVKVIARGLHHTCKPELIIGHLQKRGFKALEAVNKLKWKTKQPLNMFMLTFHQNEDVNKIYGITDIMGFRVEIMPIKKSKLVPQCKRCQAYGHTQKYCAKEPRCVKCTGKHLTIDCTKPENAKPKCIHCGEEHPANYRGCIVAKEMQKIKINLVKKNSIPQKPEKTRQDANNIRHEKPKANNSQLQTNNSSLVSYSQATSGPTKGKFIAQPNNEQNNSTDQALQLILEKLNNQEKLFSKFEERLTRLECSAKGAIPKQRNC